MNETECGYCDPDTGCTCVLEVEPVRTEARGLARTGMLRRSPLKAKSQWRPERKPLRYRSKKTSAMYVERRLLVARILDERKLCEARWDDDCQIVSMDVHEILPRSQGGNITGGEDTEYLAVCRLCHDQIETHPQESHDRGFRRWSWEGNK